MGNLRCIPWGSFCCLKKEGERNCWQSERKHAFADLEAYICTLGGCLEERGDLHILPMRWLVQARAGRTPIFNQMGLLGCLPDVNYAFFFLKVIVWLSIYQSLKILTVSLHRCWWLLCRYLETGRGNSVTPRRQSGTDGGIWTQRKFWLITWSREWVSFTSSGIGSQECWR